MASIQASNTIKTSFLLYFDLLVFTIIETKHLFGLYYWCKSIELPVIIITLVHYFFKH